MKCATNEEEAAGTEYDVGRTKQYKKKCLQNEFSSVQTWLFGQKYLRQVLLTVSRIRGTDSVMAAKLMVFGSISMSKLERTQTNVSTARPELREKTSR